MPDQPVQRTALRTAADRPGRAVVKKNLSVLAIALMLSGCQYDPYAHTFTTEEPESSDVVGRYVLQDQTIVSGGTSAMRGRPCEVLLAADGTFTATNIPDFGFESSPSSSLDRLVSGSGPWNIESVGAIDDGFGKPKTHWGVRLGSMERPLAFAGFTGEAAPYGLIFTIGDPDSGTVMLLRAEDRK